MRSSGLLKRSVVAFLACVLAGPVDFAQTDFEPVDAVSAPDLTIPPLILKIRSRPHTPNRCRVTGAAVQDQDDSRDGDSEFRPVLCSVQPSNSPWFQPSAVVPSPSASIGFHPDLNFDQLCRLLC